MVTELIASADAATFVSEGVAVGTYVLDDPFKPYLHPLRTPHGHVVSLAKPHDHRHHKGLMYALATDKVNFWEEVGNEQNPRVGRQRQDHIEFDFSLERPALRQQLTWVDDQDAPVFHETRRIECQRPDHNTVRWLWETRIEALRPERVRLSQWAEPDQRGRLINYHGLGIRFPRSFSAMTTSTEIFSEDKPVSLEDAHGAIAKRVGVRGELDGEWPSPIVEASIRQLGDQHEFFVLREPFAYLSVGPSPTGPLDMPSGAVIEAAYQIDISDRPRGE